MHIDVRNDEDLRRAAPVGFHPERKSVACDSSGIDETVLQRCNIVKKKKKTKNYGVQRHKNSYSCVGTAIYSRA